MSDAVTISDAGPMIVATVILPGCTPDRALSAFTDPALVSRWWRGELTTDLAPGGPYTVTFPAINATLHGLVVSHDPGRSLEFTWAWAGEDVPPSSVTITAVVDEPNGSVLTVTHGPHRDDRPGKQSHQEHWEGWEFFLPRLATVLSE